MGEAMPYIGMFRRGSQIPDPGLADGWFSITLEAGSVEDAERWLKQRADEISEYFGGDNLELVHMEAYKPTSEWAGAYRGLVVKS